MKKAAEALYEKALDLVLEDDYDEAINVCGKLIDMEVAEGYALRSQCHYLMEDYEKTKKDAEKAVKLLDDDNKIGAVYARKGNAHYHLGEYDDAIGDLSKAIKLLEEDDDIGTAYFDRGYTYYLIDKYDESLADMAKAVGLYEDDENIGCAYFITGANHFYLRNYDKVLANLKKGSKLIDMFPYLYFFRGVSHYKENNHDKALKDFEAYIDNDEDDTSLDFLGHAHYFRAVIYNGTERLKKAANACEQCLKIIKEAKKGGLEGNADYSYDSLYKLRGEVSDMLEALEAGEKYAPDTKKNPEAVEVKNSEAGQPEALDKLNGLIGLGRVKEEVNTVINLLKIKKMREKAGVSTAAMSLHMVFSGNPGTGKTTVARILGDLYRNLGVLSKGQLIEVDRSGLVGQYIGETALKTLEVVETAMGGILFIDEAYALASAKGVSGHDFGQEAIDTLLKAMEDNRDNLIVIAAGYEKEMETFLQANPGMQSRFNTFIHFDDYSAEELYAIFMNLVKSNSYTCTDEVKTHLTDYFINMYANRKDNFANGREVRNTFENMIKRQANRLAKLSDISESDLYGIKAEDII
ncbi:MAG: tetratricopeptide repeat protein [Defluviitaleaceae bacterium]|nr:tetratricopeptide repeat protein [Defluviitaleaceae bacterium]